VTPRGALGLVLLASAGWLGCAHHLYAGSHRSSDEVAVIETDGTSITDVDEIYRGDYSKVTVLPGLRSISVRLYDEHPSSPGWRLNVRWTRRSLRVCFVARAGRTYTVRPVYAEGTWSPEIIDQQTATVVDTDAFAESSSACEDAEGSYSEAVQLPTPLPIYLPSGKSETPAK
jgi:hypothetical protein